MLRILPVVAALSWLTGAAVADIIKVPGDYPTIQAGIDAAQDGDEVVVADGVYTGPGNWDIDFGGRSIAVRSAGGPDNCIIDVALTFNHRGFHFHSGETQAAVVDGFTITQGRLSWSGSEPRGAGIRCDNSSPTIVNCDIVGNMAIGGGHNGGFGGGIYSSGGSPAIVNCKIRNNTVQTVEGTSSGGGILCSGAPLIVDCTISANSASPTTFHVYPATIGGVSVSGAGAVVANCAITGNTAQYTGGVGAFNGATLINCSISGNLAEYPGHGVGNVGGASVSLGATLINCTITANAAEGLGGVSAAAATLRNCIVWSNSPDQVTGTPESTVTHCDVQGGWGGPGFSNIDADPLFVDAAGADGQPGTLDDNLRLQPGSPCIDAGHNWAIAGIAETDLDDNPRFADGPADDTGCGVPVVVDMGAYEFQVKPFDVRLGDINGDGGVHITDFLDLLGDWGPCSDKCCLSDLDLDGEVGFSDFLALLANWG